jgi:glycine cleavage system transcriptional repressor
MNAADQQIVLLASGQDKPGILDEVSKYLLEHGGRVDEIKMTNLRGRFAMLLLVTGDHAAISNTVAHLETLARNTGLDCSSFPAGPAAEASLPGHLYKLQVRGPNASDETETLRKLSHLLRALSINIDYIDSSTSGEGFTLELTFPVPREMPVTNLREYVDQLLVGSSVRFALAAI